MVFIIIVVVVVIIIIPITTITRYGQYLGLLKDSTSHSSNLADLLLQMSSVWTSQSHPAVSSEWFSWQQTRQSGC